MSSGSLSWSSKPVIAKYHERLLTMYVDMASPDWRDRMPPSLAPAWYNSLASWVLLGFKADCNFASKFSGPVGDESSLVSICWATLNAAADNPSTSLNPRGPNFFFSISSIISSLAILARTRQAYSENLEASPLKRGTPFLPSVEFMFSSSLMKFAYLKVSSSELMAELLPKQRKRTEVGWAKAALEQRMLQLPVWKWPTAGSTLVLRSLEPLDNGESWHLLHFSICAHAEKNCYATWGSMPTCKALSGHDWNADWFSHIFFYLS